MSVNGTVSMTFNANDIRTVGVTTGANIPIQNTTSFTYQNGSAAGQANVLGQFTFTLSGATETFDFNAGFTDSYGTPIVLTGVVAFQIQNLSITNTLAVGGAGSDPWTGILSSTETNTLQAGDSWQQATNKAGGWAVSPTSCNLLFTGTSGQTFTLAFLGVGT
jgi:hypothetical protein